MNPYQEIAKECVSGLLAETRRTRGLSQKEMAKQLHISARAYGSLERGTACSSSLTLLFLLSSVEESRVNRLITQFHSRVLQLEA